MIKISRASFTNRVLVGATIIISVVSIAWLRVAQLEPKTAVAPFQEKKSSSSITSREIERKTAITPDRVANSAKPVTQSYFLNSVEALTGVVLRDRLEVGVKNGYGEQVIESIKKTFENGGTDSQLIRLLAITGGSPEEIEMAINLLIENTKRGGVELPSSSILALYEDIEQGLIQSLEFDRAKVVTELAIARYPNESASYGLAAGAARQQEDYTGALLFLQRGLSINSNDVMLLSELAQTLHHQGENTKAILIAKELVNDHPELSGMMENILHSP